MHQCDISGTGIHPNHCLAKHIKGEECDEEGHAGGHSQKARETVYENATCFQSYKATPRHNSTPASVRWVLPENKHRHFHTSPQTLDLQEA